MLGLRYVYPVLLVMFGGFGVGFIYFTRDQVGREGERDGAKEANEGRVKKKKRGRKKEKKKEK